MKREARRGELDAFLYDADRLLEAQHFDATYWKNFTKTLARQVELRENMPNVTGIWVIPQERRNDVSYLDRSAATVYARPMIYVADDDIEVGPSELTEWLHEPEQEGNYCWADDCEAWIGHPDDPWDRWLTHTTPDHQKLGLCTACARQILTAPSNPLDPLDPIWSI